MRPDEFIGGSFEWFIGEIVTVSDPELMNRVQVRCFGFYSNALTSDELPWATVMMPNTSPSIKGVGMNHGLLVGSWVVGFFRDGPSAQDPIVMGSIASKTDGVIDIPVESQVIANTNQVCKTIGGHLIEVDNAVGDERIAVTHAKGTTILIDKDGGVHINATNNIITMNGNTTITGTLEVSGAQTNASTITATGSITGKSIVLDTHTHEGSATAATGEKSDTGSPNTAEEDG